ncbi:MAG: VCBS repeat-containing protein [Hyphomicrobiales bacterium]|nr:VCBS repeat-containing protein [Hyphomicrobiales bacterium]
MTGWGHRGARLGTGGFDFELVVGKLLLASAFGIGLASSVPGAASAQPSCTSGATPCFEWLGFLPGMANDPNAGSRATAISANGNVVVGNARNAAGKNEVFRWVAGTMSGLGTVAGSCTNYELSAVPEGRSTVNADGSVVALVIGFPNPSSPGDCTYNAYRWVSGTLSALFPACATWSYPYAVNGDGSVIVGNFSCNGGSQAFRWVNGTAAGLGTLPSGSNSTAYGVSADGTVVAGVAGGPNFHTEAFRWAGGSMTGLGYLPGQTTSAAWAISRDGSAIFGNSNSDRHWFRWSGGVMTDIVFQQSLNVLLHAANQDGTVAVGSGPMRWTAAAGGLRVDLLFKAHGINLGLDGARTIGNVFGVSADGRTIVGTGAADGDNRSQAWIARLPVGWTLGNGASTHDFDFSGKSDILWRNTTSGTLVMWLMDGVSVSQGASVGGATTDWQVVGQRDFNADGKHDILWRHSSGAVAIWLMDGATVSQAASVGGATTDWQIVGTGDFNGDGKADILWRHSTSGHVILWVMNGATVTQSAGVGGATTDWQVAGVGDLDGDGKADILWRNTSSGAVAVWLMNGASVTQAASVGGATTDWQIVGVGDFNGDSMADILWRHSSGVAAAWLMNGTSVTQAASVGGASADWTIAETGDLNGDGRSDILWRHSGGSVAAWLMNGVTVTQAASVGGATTDWVIQAANAN